VYKLPNLELTKVPALNKVDHNMDFETLNCLFSKKNHILHMLRYFLYITTNLILIILFTTVLQTYCNFMILRKTDQFNEISFDRKTGYRQTNLTYISLSTTLNSWNIQLSFIHMLLYVLCYIELQFSKLKVT